ncbi:MAG TPA: carboxypeptidase regulatory-like domain-containing protein [Thermoplasmata archaeon]|nr:carboxypeptidase regulatory-like domain-containing protein [Thermoplasmata archaeon]
MGQARSGETRPVGRGGARFGLSAFFLLFGATALLLIPLFGLLPSHLPMEAAGHLGPVPSASGASLPNNPSVSYPTPIRHVFVVFLENAELSDVQGNGPFEMGLAKNYSQATQYYAPCHPSAPEYLALTSGATWQCGSDSVSSGGYSTENIGDLAQKAGLSWAGYMESMPSACDASDSYPYVARHNPFVYYSDLSGSVCAQHDVSFADWNANVSAGTVPSFAFFAPNVTNDGHDTSVGYADGWLKGWLTPYLNASWFSSSVWFITYDEGSSNSGYNGFYGGHVFFTAVSPYSEGGRLFANNSTHYNLLATIEWLLGLGNTGNNDSSSNYPAMKGLFNFNSGPPPPQYSVDGRVTSASTGVGVVGAAVKVSQGPSTTTDSTGAYSLSLPNGTYSISASAAGYNPVTSPIVVSGSAALLNFSLPISLSNGSSYPIGGTVDYSYNSSPVPGAIVTIAGGAPFQTGSNGTFWFSEPNGSYPLTVWKDGYQEENRTVTVAGGPVQVNVLLLRFSWEVAGHVLDAVTGLLLVGANVSVVSGPISYAESSLTNESGGYAVWLPNATFTLIATAPGYASSWVSVSVAGQPIDLDIALTSLQAQFPLSGQVSYRSNGTGAAHVLIRIDPGFAVWTDASGAFLAQVPNGTYVVAPIDPGWRSPPQTVSLQGHGQSVSLFLARGLYSVRGLVHTESGSPRAGVSVSVPALRVTSSTARDGSYLLRLPNGTFLLQVSGPGIQPVELTVVVAGRPLVQNVIVSPSGSGGIWPGPGWGGSWSLWPFGGLFAWVLAMTGIAGSCSVFGLAMNRRARRLRMSRRNAARGVSRPRPRAGVPMAATRSAPTPARRPAPRGSVVPRPR